MTLVERFDAWLQRIQFKGRQLSLDRFFWQMVEQLGQRLGRKVELEGSPGEYIRLFPVFWKNKLHLFGAEREFVHVDFTSKLTMRVRRVPPVATVPGRAISAKDGSGAVVHIMLCHLPARATERLLHHAQALGKGYTVLLAYGGPKDQFDQVEWAHKIFLDDPTLRGHYWFIAYHQLINRARDYILAQGIAADWIFIGDFDTIPVRERYLGDITALMAATGAGMAGKEIRDISLSNCFFLVNHLKDGRIGPELNGPGKPVIYHCLGCGLVLHRECFDSLFHSAEGLSGTFFEVGVPTEASLNGFRLISLDHHGETFKSVRYRPVYTLEEALAATEAGAALLHPVKQTDRFLELWKEAVARKAKQETIEPRTVSGVGVY